MTLPQIHGLLGITVSLYALSVTLWLLWKYLRDQSLDGSFWGVIWTGEGLIVIQALLGITQLIMGRMPLEWVHLLYGFLTPMIWPATVNFTRNQPERRKVIIWIVVCAFLFGVTLRARFTALP